MLAFFKDNIPWIIAIAAFAANICQFILNRKNLRSQLVSGHRQKWIDNLRESLSEFRANMGTYTLVQFGQRPNPGQPWSDNTYDKCVLLSFRIKLFLNPKEDDHQKLIALVEEMMTVFGAGPTQKKVIEDAGKKFEGLSQSILKKEWERVKQT